jgi:hypothetical protein
MADSTRRVLCRNCGEMVDISQCERINTGRTQYICFTCINKGRSDVNVHNYFSRIRKEKMRKND